jgi:hypothetical protein
MQFDSVVDDALDYYARTVVTMLYLEVTASIAVDWQSFDVSCRVFLVEGCLSQSIALEVSTTLAREELSGSQFSRKSACRPGPLCL